jgi:hypothetical protein
MKTVTGGNDMGIKIAIAKISTMKQASKVRTN